MGDNITPHHMPSAKYLEINTDIKYKDGVAMNMEQPSPGKGGRHRKTSTYNNNMTKAEQQSYWNLSTREALAHDINDVIKIYKEQDLYNDKIREGLLEVIIRNKEKHPIFLQNSMKSIEDLRLQLVKNKLMRTQEEVELFESAMNELYKEPNLNNIDYFCEAFNDATEHHEVMFGLVHGIENYCKLFGVDNYFDKLVDALAKMDNNSIGWQNIIFYRILNTDWGRKALADKLKQKNDDIRNFILCAINRIKQEDNERFGYKADEILNTF